MKKAIGIIRRLDELGRVVVPIEIRRVLDWNRTDPIEILVGDGEIILRKYTEGCYLCSGVEENVTIMHGKPICKSCVVYITHHAFKEGEE